MLPAAHRLRSSRDFAEVLRRGRRAGRGTLTVHVAVPSSRGPVPAQALGPAAEPAAAAPPRAGLVVSKAVGTSVVRHRVARRVRHLLRDRLAALPPGTRLVVRAAPSAATASSAVLAADLDAALAAALTPRARS